MKEQFGFVVVIDLLGTKGIWSFQSPENVFNAWSQIHQYLIDKVKTTEYYAKVMGDKEFSIKIFSFSDTIIIAFPTKKEEIEYIPTIAQICGEIFIYAMLQYGFFFRGAISKGEYYIPKENNMILGPAIDDAAEWYEAANWAGIHFTPRASYAVENLSIDLDEKILHETVFQYNIPVSKTINNNKEVWAWVVSWPLIYFKYYDEKEKNEENINKFKNMILSKLTERPINRYVHSKFRNTIKFMNCLLK